MTADTIAPAAAVAAAAATAPAAASATSATAAAAAAATIVAAATPVVPTLLALLLLPAYVRRTPRPVPRQPRALPTSDRVPASLGYLILSCRRASSRTSLVHHVIATHSTLHGVPERVWTPAHSTCTSICLPRRCSGLLTSSTRATRHRPRASASRPSSTSHRLSHSSRRRPPPSRHRHLASYALPSSSPMPMHTSSSPNSACAFNPSSAALITLYPTPPAPPSDAHPPRTPRLAASPFARRPRRLPLRHPPPTISRALTMPATSTRAARRPARWSARLAPSSTPPRTPHRVSASAPMPPSQPPFPLLLNPRQGRLRYPPHHCCLAEHCHPPRPALPRGLPPALGEPARHAPRGGAYTALRCAGGWASSSAASSRATASAACRISGCREPSSSGACNAASSSEGRRRECLYTCRTPTSSSTRPARGAWPTARKRARTPRACRKADAERGPHIDGSTAF